ncbi:hypothetical protein BDW74DRAFT_176570 [Aspergillus multicolor]|uniref:uncharacterized protein n=1 Tax=Aspergillus multicolor TaxID=41759 RepID=UPI003CCD98A9
MDQSISLLEACANPDTLFSTPPESLIHQIYTEFPTEIDRLRRAYSVREHDQNPLEHSTPSPSHILFGEEYDEVNRTLVGLLALRWIHRRDYASFTGIGIGSRTGTHSHTNPSREQEESLSRGSFKWITDFYERVMQVVPADADARPDADALYTLITLIITNDLGKDPNLAKEYKSITGSDISHENHDLILLKAHEAGLVPSLDRLPAAYREIALSGLKLASTFNLGQRAQAENAPVCLAALLDLRKEEGPDNLRGCWRAFYLRFMEQLLDIAGAGGHMDWTCAGKLSEAVFDSYRGVFETCCAAFEGAMDLQEAYDTVLRRRAAFLIDRGVVGIHLLDEFLAYHMTSDNRAFMRLLCMGNVTSAQTAELFQSTWRDLDPSTKEELAQALSAFGARGKPAIQPTYMPAFLSGIRDRKELECALKFLGRVMTAPVTDIEMEDGHFDPSVVVIERSVLGILKEFVETGLFHEDPTVLEGVDTPKGVVALRL